jgi:peptidoglycan LD-endopeptidase LytH
MLRGLVILLIGVLVGANIVYFAMTRSARDEAGARADSQAGMAASATVAPDARAPATPMPSATDPAIAAPTSAAAASVATGAASADAGPADVEAAVGPTGLVVPVQGIAAAALTDTYNQARGGERRHEALDIMAPAGTPVVAAADGSIEKLFTSDKGGLTIYEFEPSGRYAYYYAHLERYAPGLVEKKQVRQGEVIGYVGSTGNADPAAPHLHFAIFELGPERQWWKGTPINPYPVLRAR